MASRNGPPTSYFSNTPAEHKNGNIRAAVSYLFSECPGNVIAAPYPGGASNDNLSPNSRNSFAVHGSCDALLLHNPKNISLSLIVSRALCTTVPTPRIGIFFVFVVSRAIGAKPVFSVFGMARRVPHHCRTLLHFCHRLPSPAGCSQPPIVWASASTLLW